MRQPVRVPWLLAAAVLVVSPPLRAASDGVSGRSGRAGASCAECHTGGATPVVGLTGPDGLAPGRLGTFVFSVGGGAAQVAGLDIAADAGSLSVPPGEEDSLRLWNGEITHRAPLTGETLSWTFQWVAPDAPGSYTIFAAGLAADGDGSADGDAGATTTFEVVVAGCADLDEDGYEDAACNPSVENGGGDCADGDGGISPEAVERCDGVDEDCDGLTDEDPGVRLCDDGDPCTTERCEDGVCEYDDNAAACDDGDPCSGDDHCVDGACVATVAIDCDDGDPCTADRCEPGEGCVWTPDDGASCDDGNPCTQDDVCLDGACAGVNVCPCAADADCEPFAPADRCAGTLRCDRDQEPAVCVIDPATVVVCATDDDTACARRVCDPALGVCALASAPDGTPCDVANACVSGATCQGGACTGGAAAECDDGNDCTEDVCDPVGGCLHLNALIACDDGDACTQGDQCRGGICIPGLESACQDANPCTRDSCDAATGCRHEPLDGAACSDGDACSVGDVCAEGVCVALDELECDDENPCTEDFCDPTQGCVNAEVDRACDDGDPCTVDDRCHAGRCLPGPAAACDDGEPCTVDGCDAATGCRNEPREGACDDGDPCTVGDTCADGVCVGRDRTCDDFDVCTSDACDPQEGCVFTPLADCCVVDEDCRDGQACVQGTCRGGALCAPCAADDECGGPDDACVALPGGRYCGVACADDEDCPAAHVCEDVPGADRLQCVPDAEKVTCVCTPRFERRCHEGDVHWFDACGELGEIQQSCPFGCVGSSCVPDDDPRDDVGGPGGDVAAPADTGGGASDGDGEGGGGGCASGPAAPGPAPSGVVLVLLGVVAILRRVRVEPVA